MENATTAKVREQIMPSNRTKAEIRTEWPVEAFPNGEPKVNDIIQYVAGKKRGLSRAIVLKLVVNADGSPGANIKARDLALYAGKERYVHKSDIERIDPDQSVPEIQSETSAVALTTVEIEPHVEPTTVVEDVAVVEETSTEVVVVQETAEAVEEDVVEEDVVEETSTEVVLDRWMTGEEAATKLGITRKVLFDRANRGITVHRRTNATGAAEYMIVG